MSAAIPSDDESLLWRVDRACDRFEAHWKAGEPPRIEDHLDGVPERDRAALLGELVPLDVSYRRRAGQRPAPEDYRRRFPDQADVIAAAFAGPMPAPAGPARPLPAASAGTATDSNLLFGILALQLDFVTRDALIAAMNAWALEQSKPLGRLLVEQGALADAQHALVETLLHERLKPSGDAPPAGPARRDPGRAGPASRDEDPHATRDGAVGQPTAAGPRFLILRPHAQGGLGTVFVALDTELNRQVALKEIRARRADEPTSRARFLREAEITGGLEHPGIVPIYALGAHPDGRPYYAMRFIRGDSLRDEIKQFHEVHGAGRDPGGRELGLRRLLRRFLDVCNAIDYAHGRGVLHRDIKPANIMVGKHGETLVVDWGLAKAMDEAAPGTASEEKPLLLSSSLGAGVTRHGAALGTPAFMSPEQASGELDRLGPASDIYSLGATLSVLLTGRDPMERLLAEQLHAARPRRGAPPPGRLGPGIDRALEAICRKAMAEAPEDRYATARDLADDLEHWLADEPVAAWREPAGRRLARWVRQHRPEVRAGAAALLAITLISVVAAGALRHARRVEAVLADQDAARQAVATFDRFQRGRDAALFHASRFLGLDPASGRDATRAAIRAALAAVGLAEDGAGELDLAHPYLVRRRAEIATGCAELLLLLAEVEAPTPVDRTAPDPPDRPRRALELLDRAARLAAPSWVAHLQRAAYLARLGDEPAAQAERRRASLLTPGAFDHFYRGLLHHVRDDPAAALPDFQRALGLRPRDFWAQYYAAICFLKLGRPEEARAHLTACIGRRPDVVSSYLARGFALGELGETDLAEADFRTALGLGPDAAVRFAILVNRGRVRLQGGRHEAARADLEAAAALEPRRHEAYVAWAQVYGAKARWDEAVALLDRAVALAPDRAGPYRDRARARIARQDPAAALADLEQAIGREADRPRDLAEDHVDRGLILYRARRFEEAVAAYDAALAAQPDLAAAHRLRADALKELDRNEEAVAALDRAIRFGATDADAYRLRGLLRLGLGRIAGAMEDFTRALELEPDSSNVRTRRGWSYVLRSLPLALQDFDRALQQNPTNSDAHAGRGYALVLLGRSREAVEAAEQAVRCAPPVPALLSNAACVFAQAAGRVQADPAAGDLASRYGQRALDLIRQALELKPPQERAAFWQEAIAPDAALDPIRHTAGFAQLEAEFGPAAP